MKICPCCKRPFPPQFRVSGPIRQRIVNIIAEHGEGISRSDVAAFVYASDPNGGPNTTNSISVLVGLANEELRKQGYFIHSRQGRGSVYRLLPVERN